MRSEDASESVHSDARAYLVNEGEETLLFLRTATHSCMDCTVKHDRTASLGFSASSPPLTYFVVSQFSSWSFLMRLQSC